MDNKSFHESPCGKNGNPGYNKHVIFEMDIQNSHANDLAVVNVNG